MQSNYLRVCGYFCIGFINFIQECKIVLHYTKLPSTNEYEKNDKTILEYFAMT